MLGSIVCRRRSRTRLTSRKLVLIVFDLSVIGYLLLRQLAFQSANLALEELQFFSIIRLSDFCLLCKYLGIKFLNLTLFVIYFTEQCISFLLLHFIAGNFICNIYMQKNVMTLMTMN